MFILIIFCSIYIVILNYRNGDLAEQIEDLEERLYNLEKDAVKVTFQPKPNPKQFDGIKSEEPFVKTRTKRKPKTTKEWEDEFDLGGHE
jgi:hypothetical protein